MAFNVTLISPQTSPTFNNINSTFKSLPPQTGLAILGSVTKKKMIAQGHDDFSILAYDNPALEKQNIEKFAGSDIVGISTIFSNYPTALSWAREIKKVNPKIKNVVGGPYATNLNSRILASQQAVDYVVIGDGEDVLWRIIRKEDPEDIPNLYYRQDDGKPMPPSLYRDLSSLSEVGIFDFSCYPSEHLKSYLANQNGQELAISNLPLVLSWIRGCSKAEDYGRCSYCSIPGRKVRLTPPDLAWQQLRHMHDTYGVTSFFESGDNFLVEDYPEQLLSSKERVKGIKLRTYIVPTEFSPSRAVTLKELGVTEVYIGIENPDPQVMEWSGHKVSEQTLMRTLEILKANNISSTIAFLFGLPGESNESLKRQERLAREIIDKHYLVCRVLISLGIPLIGSRWFSELENDSEIVSRVLADTPTDLPDYFRLLELSIQKRCSVSLGAILQAMERIRDEVSMQCSLGSFGALERTSLNSILMDHF